MNLDTEAQSLRTFRKRRSQGFQRQIINRRRLPRHAVMIHRIGTVRPNLHFKHGVDAAAADPLDRNSNVGQVLSQPPVVNREINELANPLWR
jgi:hypothetical protein